MKTIELTQGFSCIVDDDEYEELIKHSWCISNDGYACRGIRIENGSVRLVRMHRQIMGMVRLDKKRWIIKIKIV